MWISSCRFSCLIYVCGTHVFTLEIQHWVSLQWEEGLKLTTWNTGRGETHYIGVCGLLSRLRPQDWALEISERQEIICRLYTCIFLGKSTLNLTMVSTESTLPEAENPFRGPAILEVRAPQPHSLTHSGQPLICAHLSRNTIFSLDLFSRPLRNPLDPANPFLLCDCRLSGTPGDLRGFCPMVVVLGTRPWA
jgi:hypothetical protein